MEKATRRGPGGSQSFMEDRGADSSLSTLRGSRNIRPGALEGHMGPEWGGRCKRNAGLPLKSDPTMSMRIVDCATGEVCPLVAAIPVWRKRS